MVKKNPVLGFEHGISFFEHRLSAGTGTNSDSFRFIKTWREKFVCGEFDVFENFAGVVGCCDAFFSGNAEIVCGNKHLNSAFQLNNGEKSEGDKNSSCAGNAEISLKKIRDGFREGDFRNVHIAVALIRKTAVKHNGRNHLNNSSRVIGSHSRSFKRQIGTEDLDVSFASVKNHFFREKSDSRYVIRGGNRGVIC